MTILTLTVSAATMLQSCTYHDKETINERSSIVMGVASAATKAIVDGNSDADRLGNMVSQCFVGNTETLKENAGFGVYGYKRILEKSTILFDNTRVYPEQSTWNTAWDYSPTRFWDLTASYQFIAYWPYLPDEASLTGPYVSIPDPDPANPTAVTEDEKELTIHNIPYWQHADTAMDVMTSVRVGRYRSITDADGTDFSERDKVGFMFRHVLSNLVIKAYYINGTPDSVGHATPDDKTDDGVYIKDITFMESDASDDVFGNGKADFTHLYTDRKASLSSETPLVYTDDPFALLTGARKRVEFKNEWVDDPNFVPSTIGSWLVVPHRWNGIKIGVNYTVGGVDKSSMSKPVATTLGVESENYMLQAGKTYTLTLLFDVSNGNVIVHNIGVNEWAVQDVTYYVYNW